MRFLLLLVFVFHFPTGSLSQVVKSVVLDSVVIQAVKRGFDVSDFIEMVKSDTSFIKGFRQLRIFPHKISGNLTVYNKKGKVTATRTRKGQQYVKDGRRWIEIEEEKSEGKFYDRRGEPKLYTAELFDDLFFYADTVSVKENTIGENHDGNTDNISKLTRLVFNPGSEISGVPLIGNRMAIFDDEMVDFYNYSLKADLFSDSIPCYVFSVFVKSGYEGDVVIQRMNTWFNRKTFDIVFRDYRISHRTSVFDFDVMMKIRMTYSNFVLYPGQIEYSGYWDLPFKKAERSGFELNFKIK